MVKTYKIFILHSLCLHYFIFLYFTESICFDNFLVIGITKWSLTDFVPGEKINGSSSHGRFISVPGRHGSHLLWGLTALMPYSNWSACIPHPPWIHGHRAHGCHRAARPKEKWPEELCHPPSAPGESRRRRHTRCLLINIYAICLYINKSLLSVCGWPWI